MSYVWTNCEKCGCDIMRREKSLATDRPIYCAECAPPVKPAQWYAFTITYQDKDASTLLPMKWHATVPVFFRDGKVSSNYGLKAELAELLEWYGALNQEQTYVLDRVMEGLERQVQRDKSFPTFRLNHYKSAHIIEIHGIRIPDTE